MSTKLLSLDDPVKEQQILETYTAHVRRSVALATDNRTRAARLFILARCEAELKKYRPVG